MKLLDAQAAMGFLINQTSYIEQQINQVQYADIQYPSLIPVDTSANEWAKTVTYYSGDKYGAAKWLNLNSGDVPLAGSEMTKFETPVYGGGIGYGYGLEELSQAALLGIPLQTNDAAAARRAYEEFVDAIALLGDATKGMQGLINNSAVTAAALTTGTWGTATPAQILADINGVLTSQGTGTNWVSLADTLLLPYTKFNILATTQLPNTTMNLFNWLMANNVYTAQTGKQLRVRATRLLDTAGSGSTARVVAYRRAPDVLKMHIPMPHRFLPVWQQTAVYWQVPGIFRLGGLDIRKPKEVRYGDGA